jgi:hypothetical protein
MNKGILVPCLAVLLTVPMMVLQSLTPAVSVAEAPEVVLGELEGFSSEALGASEAELKVLPSDTVILKRRYYLPSGDWFLVSAVIGGKSKSSIHRPELCLPAQGNMMENPHTIRAAGTDWRVITLSARGMPPVGFAYTFFNQNGFRTCSHIARICCDIFDRSVFNRIDRWVMITVSSSRSDDISLRAFLSKLEPMVK